MARKAQEYGRDEDYFIDLVYGKSGKPRVTQNRFTQDSPILPDVFVHYGLKHDDVKDGRLDLLLTPDWNKSPAELAEELELRLSGSLNESGNSEANESVEKFKIANNQSVVAARLTFEELICSILPLSWWWQSSVMAVDGLDPARAINDPDRPYLRERIRNELRVKLKIEIGEIEPNQKEMEYGLIKQDLAWAARLFWVIQHSNREDGKNKPDDDIEGIINYFMDEIIPRISKCQEKYKETIKKRKSDVENRKKEVEQKILGKERLAASEPEGLEVKKKEFHKLHEEWGRENERREVRQSPWVYQIDRNRTVISSSLDSAATTKVDAAIKTFDVRGKGITWAIIDTGIDARHLAFRKIKDGKPIEKPFGQDGSNNTRIKATYDFSNIRDLLSSDAKRGLVSSGGRMVDWEALERELGDKLRIPHREWGEGDKENPIPGYKAPVQAHGTHVAGIMGADMRPVEVEVDPLGPPQSSSGSQETFTGLCPEVEFYDLRVFDESGYGDEFAVMSALQFVRSLNQRHDHLEVHGVNLSLAMRHEVSNYACGRTPVCVECERLVGNGVVVVAAAGNEGRSIHTTVQNTRQEGYRLAGISDPGNTEAVITVGSTHRKEPHNYGVSYFSSRGPTGDGRLKPDLVAPGEKIYSTVPGDRFARQDGTSQAAPHVSAAAVLLMSRHTEMIGNPNRVKKVLMDTATDLGRERYFQGAGLVDVMRAIQSV